MQHLIFKTLLVVGLVLFFVSPSAFAYNEPEKCEALPICPPPPPPTGLTSMGINSTDYMVSWTAPNAPFHQIVVTDVTSATTFPPIFGIGNQATITGHAGHDLLVEVRVAQCVEGAYSLALRGPATPGIIIVDKIIGLQAPCRPSVPFSGGLVHDVCVLKSPLPPNQFSFETGYVGRIKYQDSELKFAIVYLNEPNSAPQLRIGKLVNQETYDPLNPPYPDFYFPFGSQYEAKCYYKYGQPQQKLIFSAYAGQMTLTDAKASLHFAPDFFASAGSSYTYCTSCTGGPNPVSGEEGFDRNTPDQTNTDQIPSLASVSPNPFNESTTVQYSLATPNPVSIQLYDATGHLVQTVQPSTPLLPGEYTATIEGSNLPKGAYFVMIQKGGERQILTLVKQD